MTAPGWYHVETDPPGTTRYWDGSTWIGEPQYSPAVSQSGTGAIEQLSPFGWFKKCWTRGYADFSGRARRAEYGWFTLISLLVAIFLAILVVFALAGAETDPVTDEIDFDTISPLFWIGVGAAALYVLASIIPTLAVGVRRWHDMGHSGWMTLLYIPAGFIPFGNLLLTLWQVFADSKHEANKWGTSPKYG